jgi:hypothetical protein
MMDWNEVAAAGLSFPGVELGTSYGRPALKVRGRAIAVAGRTDDHVVLMVSGDEVEILIETDPRAFYQDDHFKGWPAVQGRCAALDPVRVALLIERAWERRASRAQLAARDP